MIGRARRAGQRLRHRRRRVLVRAVCARLRAARSPVARRPARRRRRSHGVRSRHQAPSRRLRPLEVGQTRRAGMALAVGRRAPRVAQRVRGDEPATARRGFRPPRRRAGPALSAPRERAGPGGGPRQALLPTTGSTTGSSSTPTARRCPRASATSTTCSISSSSTTRGRTACCCCRATTAARLRVGQVQPGGRREIVERTRRLRWLAGPLSMVRCPMPRCSIGSGQRWTTTSTRPRRWRWCSTPCAGPTRCSTPPTTGRRLPLVAAVREIAGAVGLRAR